MNPLNVSKFSVVAALSLTLFAAAACNSNAATAKGTVKHASDIRKWTPEPVSDATTPREFELAESLVSGSLETERQMSTVMRELDKLDAGASLALAPYWARCLGSPHALVRYYALDRLARLRIAATPYAAAIKVLLFTDPDNRVRPRAAWALAAINGLDAGLIAELGGQLDTAQGEDKAVVLEALAYYAHKLGGLETKVEALTHHENRRVANRAIHLYNLAQSKSYIQGQLMTETQKKARLALWLQKSQGETFVFGRETCGLTMGKYEEFKAAGKNPLLVDIDEFSDAQEDMYSLLLAKTTFRGGDFMLPVVLTDSKVWYRK